MFYYNENPFDSAVENVSFVMCLVLFLKWTKLMLSNILILKVDMIHNVLTIILYFISDTFQHSLVL